MTFSKTFSFFKMKKMKFLVYHHKKPLSSNNRACQRKIHHEKFISSEYDEKNTSWGEKVSNGVKKYVFMEKVRNDGKKDVMAGKSTS